MFVKRELLGACVLVAVGLLGSTAAWALDGGPAPEACCMLDGSCREMPANDCLAIGGEPQGPGSVCVGDWDGDGADETCESKWIQPPDVATTGVDVADTLPIALADDFLCTETSAITRIIVWGSWLGDAFPYDPANVNITLMLREDIPDPDGSGPLFSMPGRILWSRSYRPYTFRVEAYRKDIQEGFWYPSDPDSYVFPGDTICWMYTFDVPVSEAFCQQGTPEKPIVYWLDVQATIPPYPGPAPVVFGWKTSTRHWNDDGVWQYRSGGISTPFRELRYPKGHPWEGRSMDLAFALESQSCVGACCYADGCRVTTELACETMPVSGEWMGPGTNCDDLDGDGVADVCEFLFEEACCFPDGTCSMLTPWHCEDAGGLAMGPGTTCTDDICPPVGACCQPDSCRITTELECSTGTSAVWMGAGTDCDDLDGDGVADVCETAVFEACCTADGSCKMMTVAECREAGGAPQGPGSACVGDLDGDGMDETCEAKWIAPPDLAKTGIDVDDSFPLMLADDWLCTETDAITRIYVWASWLNDVFPVEPGNVSFALAIHKDVPDPDGSGPLFSMPGEVLWKYEFKPYTFRVEPFQSGIEEGFWDPSRPDSYIFPGDTVCWLYVFDIPDCEAFCQEGSPSRPVVYWLSIQATPGPSPLPVITLFGWKTSTRHWNDDAVFCQNTGSAVTPWRELRYPDGHPWAKKSIDLSFALETEPCVVGPAEREGN